MKQWLIIGLIGATIGIINLSCSNKKDYDPKVQKDVDIANNLDFARRQLQHALTTSYSVSKGYPRSVEHGMIQWVKSGDWTSGFFPGELWYLYQYTGKDFWKEQAVKWTAGLKDQQYNTGTHDVGFMMYSSYGNGYRLTHNADYKKILLQSARSLASRFNPKVGAIKSWDNPKWQYPVIIDNMMNLQLLFWATAASGDSTFYNIAKQHALTTLKHQFRPDGGSYHVVSYDTTNGNVRWRGTSQGYADYSTWARGEAWGLYGFTMVYRYTKDGRFLKQARKIAHFILTNSNMPDDDVPYWDYDAPDIPKEPRDASAAAIMSSAFIRLSRYVGEKDSTAYINIAQKMLNSLSRSPYRARKIGSNHGFILLKSVGNKPVHSEVSVPIVYADYYYIQASIRYLNLIKEKTK